jgi:kynurenine formamidase
MKINLSITEKNYKADLNRPMSLAITLKPNDKQPNHFGVNDCTSEVVQSGDFIGDTKQGGSCNVNRLTLIPHCNGTHTESVSHVVDELVPVYQAIPQSLFACVVISIEPISGKEVDDSYSCLIDETDKVITRKQLESCLASHNDNALTGLVIRTLPNTDEKQTAVYNSNNYPAFLSNDAMSYLLERKVQHLILDIPSVDKMYDEGKLSNHRIFWQVAQGSKSLSNTSLVKKTITEMAFVNNTIADGCYLCNLQVPEIDTDAVPSRPVLFSLKEN